MSEQSSTNPCNGSGTHAAKDGKCPVHAVRYRNIKAAVWENQTANGPMFNVTVSRSYLDGDVWKDSSSFGYDDLLLLAKALDDAHTWITSEKRRLTESSRGAEPAGV